MNDKINAILEKLDPRDILSYMLPGSLVLLSTLHVIFEEYPPNLLTKLPATLHLLIFLGFSYIFGFMIYHGGVFVRILKEHERENNKEHFNKIKEFQKLDEKVQKDRERIVILKQMCGCSSLSIFLAYIIYHLKFWDPEWGLILPTIIILIISFLSWKIHGIFRKRQTDFEDFHLSKA